DPGQLADLPAEPRLQDLFGVGHLAITFEPAESEHRYQGVVPLEGESLSAAVEGYFARSEQVPTLIRTAMALNDGRAYADGLLLNQHAEGTEGREQLHIRMDHAEWVHI